jgi:hypothetical protein
MARYQAHSWHVERADYFRVLATYKLGGLYADNDVEPLVPIDQWLPKFGYTASVASNLLVVGVEFPRSRGGLSLQIVNYNFLSTHPGHPALRAVIDAMNNASAAMAEGADSVIFRTGPLAFTRGVFQWLGHGVDPAATEASGVLFERTEEAGQWGDTGTRTGTGAGAGAGAGTGRRRRTWRLLVLPYRAFGHHPQHGRAPPHLNLSRWVPETAAAIPLSNLEDAKVELKRGRL